MMLPLILPFLSAVHGIQITRFIHTETQDGKSVLDAHFTRSMQVLIAWLKEGNNCVTPTQAVVGLKSHGGLPNCVVELVEHDRQTLQTLVQQVAGMEKVIRRYIKRANDVKIEFQQSNSLHSSGTGYLKCPDFVLTAFQYSDIGTGLQIWCSPMNSRCVVDLSQISRFAPSFCEQKIAGDVGGGIDDELDPDNSCNTGLDCESATESGVCANDTEECTSDGDDEDSC
jgi:hypothetical protein